MEVPHFRSVSLGSRGRGTGLGEVSALIAAVRMCGNWDFGLHTAGSISESSPH